MARCSIASTACTSGIANRRDERSGARNLEFYSRRRPIQKITAGDTLRILDPEHFEVVWTADDWKTTQNVASRELGSAGFSADVGTADQASGGLSWTLHWPGQNRWLGYNVDISIEPQNEA